MYGHERILVVNTELDYLSAERLALMFFPHLTRACGIALVQELWKMHHAKPENS